jgi:hypothetical protein
VKLNLFTGDFWHPGYGVGKVTAMYDLDGEETQDPSLCDVCTVDLGRPGHELRVPVREWWLEVEMAN